MKPLGCRCVQRTLLALLVGTLAACEGVPTPAPSPESTPAPRPTPTLIPPPAPEPTPTPRPTRTPSFLLDFTNGRWLEQTDPQLASLIEGLRWAQDGIDSVEAETLQTILYIAAESLFICSLIVALDWVQDDITATEAGALEGLHAIAHRDGALASSVVSLDWVQDDISDPEAVVIDDLYFIASEDPGIASAVVALDWVQDGISDSEAAIIDDLYFIASEDPGIASAVVALDWIQDGISDPEAAVIDDLHFIASQDAGTASAVVALDWVQDGVIDPEAMIINDLYSIVAQDADAALHILRSSLLESIEPPDVSAVAALGELAAFYSSSFARVITHAALEDGVSNDLAPVVSTLNGVAQTNPDLIDALLDAENVSIERRTIALPLSGEVILAIIRTSRGAERSMDLLEHSVRTAEEYMDTALPTNYVGLLFEDAVIPTFAGTNYGTHMSMLPEYDVDDGSHEATSTGHIIAHEVAHYYWSGNEEWIDEGAADFMATVIENARIGSPIEPDNPPCAHAANIAELKRLDTSTDDPGHLCNYSLGERLFLDMRRSVGGERFQRAFRNLYLASLIADDPSHGQGTSVGIGDVREAFQANGGDASIVVARWYDGTEPYDPSPIDSAPVDPDLPSINGRIDEAYVATDEDGPAVSGFSARDAPDRVYLMLKYSYDVSRPQAVALEIVEYYQDGFVFDRRVSTTTAEAGYIGGTSWFPVGPGASREWAPGRYAVHVYAGERKVAEVTYQVANDGHG